jgi:hypothetical protein
MIDLGVSFQRARFRRSVERALHLLRVPECMARRDRQRQVLGPRRLGIQNSPKQLHVGGVSRHHPAGKMGFAFDETGSCMKSFERLIVGCMVFAAVACSGGDGSGADSVARFSLRVRATPIDARSSILPAINS